VPIAVFARGENAQVIISVTDQRQGNPRGRPRAHFRQVLSSDEGDGRSVGTGLGLSIARGFRYEFDGFMDVLEGRGPGFVPDEEYLHRLVARAILFKETERIVSRQKFGGYRANVVTFTIAWLSHQPANRVDLESIWAAQGLSAELSSFVENDLRSRQRACDQPAGRAERH
jgi:hypothetical protein